MPDFAFGIGKVIARHDKQQSNRRRKRTLFEYTAEGKRAGTEQIWEKMRPQGERFPNKPGTKHPRSMIIRLPLWFDTPELIASEFPVINKSSELNLFCP